MTIHSFSSDVGALKHILPRQCRVRDEIDLIYTSLVTEITESESRYSIQQDRVDLHVYSAEVEKRAWRKERARDEY